MSKSKKQEVPVITPEEYILGLSREDLLAALKKRKGYKPEAEDIIVRESIRRGLITSEKDLDNPEFNPRVSKFSFFPCPESDISRDRIIKSLMRSLMIPGIIPVYFGIMKMGVAKYMEGSALISAGVLWILMALLIMLKNERRVLVPMFFLLLLSALYAGRIMLAYEFLQWADFFIPVVLYLFGVYALIYSFILLRDTEKAKKP